MCSSTDAQSKEAASFLPTAAERCSLRELPLTVALLFLGPCSITTFFVYEPKAHGQHRWPAFFHLFLGSGNLTLKVSPGYDTDVTDTRAVYLARVVLSIR